jgi:outer membrane protein
MNTTRILAGVALIVATAAHAQQTTTGNTGTAPQRITFAQAIDIALKQNLTVQQAENNLEIANATANQARQNLLPDFSFRTSGSDQIGQTFSTTTGRFETKQTQTVQPSVGSNFLIYDASRTSSNAAAARQTAVAQSYDLSRTRQTAVFTVASDFVALENAKSQLDVQKENLTAQQAQLNQIQQFANAGVRPMSDLYQQQANVAAGQLSVTQAERGVEVAKMNLMQALQLDASKDYDFISPPIPDVNTSRTFNLDSLVRSAYQHRPDIVAAQRRIDVSLQDVRAAKAGRMPSVTGNLGYGTAWTSALDSGVFNQFNQKKGGSVSLGFTLPIFDRGSVRLQQQRAAIEGDNARLALANQQQTVAIEVRRAWYDVRSAQSQLTSANAQQVAAQQALEAVQQRYNVGAATLLEITQARTQLVNAQSALQSARYNLVLTQAVLSYYTGELDPANVRIGG